VTYGEWTKYHGTAFGFATEAEGKMLLSWCNLFREMGITPDELRSATASLAANDPPVWRSEHFQALRDRVRELRQPPKPAPPPDEPPPGDCGTCRDCGGTGRVIVPAVGLRTAGGNVITRPGSTGAVVCRCPLGRWFADRCRVNTPAGERGMLTLEAYERYRPDWRREADQEREAARLKVQAGGLDAALGQIFARLRKGPTDAA
jgi:hypothetical protein